MVAARYVRITVGAATATAELHATSPKTTDAFWSSLPIDALLQQSMWCGATATLSPASPSLTALTDEEDAVCSIYPGEMLVRPRGEEVLIAFGTSEVRDELGVGYANRLGRIVDGHGALFDAMKLMYEKGDSRIRIERADGAAAAKPAPTRRLIEVEVAGAKARYALLEDWAPKTTALLWDMLPIETTTFYSRWAGDTAIVETRPEKVATLLEGPLEASATSIYKGYLMCGPTPRWMDIYLSFGGAECRGAPGRRYGTIAAQVQGDATALFEMLRRTRREGEKPVVIRRVGG